MVIKIDDGCGGDEREKKNLNKFNLKTNGINRKVGSNTATLFFFWPEITLLGQDP